MSDKIDIGVDLRTWDAGYAISALREYLEVTEAQMAEAHRSKLNDHDARRPKNATEQQLQMHDEERDYLGELYAQELTLAMRYSFVILLHIVFETHLRTLCDSLRTERNLSISVSDLRGSDIERTKVYLNKVANVPVGEFEEWNGLRNLQKVRNCIVHYHGFVAESGDERHIRELAKEDDSVSIGDDGRLSLTKAYCDRHLSYVDSFFRKLFGAIGWQPVA